MTGLDRTLNDIIAAHGGRELWHGLTALEAVLSVDGFLFRAKRIAPLQRVRMLADTTAPQLTLFDWPAPGQRGEWFGDAEVRIITADGFILGRRCLPRRYFKGLRRELWWDPLDFLYFAGYACWNYLTTPFLFLTPGFAFETLPPPPDGSLRLAVTFPPAVPTHCPRQIFHFDAQGKLLRLDYTAEVVGRWASAAHLCSEYRDFDGLRAPTRRRVLPLFHRQHPLSFPTLVDIEVHALRQVCQDDEATCSI